MTTWKSGSSLAFELDVALSSINEYAAGAGMPAEFGELLRSIPDDLNSEIRTLYQASHGWASILEFAAWLAGSLFEENYSRATLPIRDLTAAAALERLAEAARSYRLSPDPALPVEEALVDLGWRLRGVLYQQAGIPFDPNSAYKEILRREFALSASILNGGSNHHRFWRWVDRFYFEYYAPWRETQLDRVDRLRETVIAAAGAPSGDGLLDLDWLPDQNPLWYQPGLRDAVLSGKLNVFFFLEPFGIADAFELYPGWVMVTIAQPGPIYENFREFAIDVSGRANALADPTRLVILRLIRHFGMVNTEIARYLGISRPTVSVHARILREAGLIESEQVGREMRHKVIPSEVRRLFRDLDHFLDLPPEENEVEVK